MFIIPHMCFYLAISKAFHFANCTLWFVTSYEKNSYAPFLKEIR